MTSVEQKNTRVGVALTLVVAGIFVYSFIVIRHRGALPEPTNLTKMQKILRGL